MDFRNREEIDVLYRIWRVIVFFPQRAVYLDWKSEKWLWNDLFLHHLIDMTMDGKFTPSHAPTRVEINDKNTQRETVQKLRHEIQGLFP